MRADRFGPGPLILLLGGDGGQRILVRERLCDGGPGNYGWEEMRLKRLSVQLCY